MASASVLPLEKVAALPDGVRENVLMLQNLQGKYQKEFLKFLKERQEVQTEYEVLFTPMYEKRREIVTGEREPTSEEVKKGDELMKKKEEENEESKVEALDDEEEAKKDEEEEVDASIPKEDTDSGIPKFWLRALKNNDTVMELVQDKDEPILEHLVDISCKSFDLDPKTTKEEENTGFTLKFFFKTNEFFTNETLTKTYYTKLDEEDGDELLVKAVGCDIEWKEGMNTTVKTKNKKQVKGQKSRVVQSVETVLSFFNFFKPPYASDEDLTQELAEEMEDDYMMGCEIRKYVIPRAVSWYTGEAAGLGIDLDGGDDDDEEDEEDEEGGSKGDCKQQ